MYTVKILLQGFKKNSWQLCCHQNILKLFLSFSCKLYLQVNIMKEVSRKTHETSSPTSAPARFVANHWKAERCSVYSRGSRVHFPSIFLEKSNQLTDFVNLTWNLIDLFTRKYHNTFLEIFYCVHCVEILHFNSRKTCDSRKTIFALSSSYRNNNDNNE